CSRTRRSSCESTCKKDGLTFFRSADRVPPRADQTATRTCEGRGAEAPGQRTARGRLLRRVSPPSFLRRCRRASPATLPARGLPAPEPFGEAKKARISLQDLRIDFAERRTLNGADTILRNLQMLGDLLDGYVLACSRFAEA